jgi:hypothetical protein
MGPVLTFPDTLERWKVRSESFTGLRKGKERKGKGRKGKGA